MPRIRFPQRAGPGRFPSGAGSIRQGPSCGGEVAPLQPLAPGVSLCRMATLASCLPEICEPLRSVTSKSKYAATVPENWFHVPLSPIYALASRRPEQQDPAAPNAFVTADVNVICRDPLAAGAHLRHFGRVLAGHLRAIGLGDMPKAIEKGSRCDGSQYPIEFT